MSSEATTGEEAHAAARERVQMPALFLMANGALNLLVGLFQVGLFVTVAAAPPETVQRVWLERMRPLAGGDGPAAAVVRQSVERAQAAAPEKFKRQQLVTDGLLAALLLTVALLGVAGGVCMYRARAYPMAVVGSLATLLPCLSPMACCCVGELIGLWCVVVLLLPGVRAAFR